MIQANELRIGNRAYQTLKSGSCRKRKVQIDIEHLTRIVLGTGSFNYEPIPLDESWLRRAKGFSMYKDNPSSFRNNHFILEKDLFQDVWNLRKIMTSETSILLHDEIKHVHQLQNLIFCLSGTELEFSEETA